MVITTCPVEGDDLRLWDLDDQDTYNLCELYLTGMDSLGVEMEIEVLEAIELYDQDTEYDPPGYL